ncbi:unnamed protein product, partial [Porites lobata]
VRAIHLEIVESLSTDRVLPSSPTTFHVSPWVASYYYLRQREVLCWSRERINDLAVLNKVRWIFTTPYSPHQ